MKKQTILFASLLFLTLFSCNENKTEKIETPEKSITIVSKKEFTDDLGEKVYIPFPPKRIIGLAPNLTEILFKICQDSQIVGRTQNCNFPNTCLKKPIINTYPLDIEGLILLKPDLILVTEGITSLSDINRMKELGLNVYYFKDKNISELVNSFETIGNLTENSKAGQLLAETIFTQIEDVKVESEKRPKVLALASKSPIYVYGQNTLFTEKIFIAGAQNAVQDQFSSPYPEVNVEYILKLNPDIIIGGSFDDLETSFFSIYPELKKTKAYIRKNIFSANADLMTRPSPRIIESIHELKLIVEKAK